MKKKLQLITIYSLCSVTLLAQSSDTATPPTEQANTAFKISGFADVYYQYALKETAYATSFTEQPNSFTLGMASVKLEKNVKKVGVVADLGWGPRADNANGSIGTSLASIKQLYISYAPSDKLKLTLGNFFTYLGYEVVDAPPNMNYSMSYGFSKGPFFHTGFKAEYTLNENWAVLAGIFDETDKKFDIDGPKNAGIQLAYKKGNLKTYFNYLSGKVSSDSSGLINHQIDFTGTYQVSPKLSLGINASDKMYHRNGTGWSDWQTYAVYGNYAFSSKYALALRTEYFVDSDGEALGTPKNNIVSTTLSHNFTIDNLKFIAETRCDWSKQSAFWDSKKASPTKALPSLILAAIYSF
jgi:hypothetical protein